MNTEILRAKLSQVAVGDDVSYKVLSGLIAQDVQRGRGRSWLSAARRVVFRETGALFIVDTNVGLHRATDAQALDATQSAIKSIRRRGQRAGAVLSTLRPENLTPDERSRLYAQVTICAIAVMATESRTEKKILAAVSKSQSALPSAATLDLIKSL